MRQAVIGLSSAIAAATGAFLVATVPLPAAHRTLPSGLALFIFRPHATRLRSVDSIAACAISIRSGTANPRRFSRMS
jgi:hypothetical protein